MKLKAEDAKTVREYIARQTKLKKLAEEQKRAQAILKKIYKLGVHVGDGVVLELTEREVEMLNRKALKTDKKLWKKYTVKQKQTCLKAYKEIA